MSALRVVILGSGTGSNFDAIARASREGRCDVTIVAVVSDRSNAPILVKARERNIATKVVRFDRGDRPGWNVALAKAVEDLAPQVVVLAGFMRILGPAFVSRFEGRILNVHPSLLPAFPGSDAPAQALAAGVEVTGCTVHVVDEGVDTGPVLAQAEVRVEPGDSPQTLHRRIQVAEHALFPAVLHRIARGELTLRAGDAR